MKYILITNQEEKEDDVSNDIAEFLWDAGHEVDVADTTQVFSENKKLHADYDCHISIIGNHDAGQSVLDMHRSVFKNFNACKKAGSILIFSNTGVYTDAIPYPHRIFDYNHLDRASLQRFFRWCRKISLFIKA
ncbi:hypothetical protein [Chryseobacterium gregarium]|uniref:hypothetical protein n=1 Tax=Chryseobacterium gregarium TaxID=456299 RepID=UPI000426F162|nr:hypothetical protein [Chryseobacterium gregarium]